MANRVFPYLKTAAPTVNDDTGDGYKVGDEWLDTTNDIMYKAIDVTAGAAIWVELVGRTQTQTLTNKTLTTPTIADFTNAAHDHGDADDGGAVVSASTTTAGVVEIATGTEVDTGTDDVRATSPKALNDSHNVPSVAPGTSGNIMKSDGTDWTSAEQSTLTNARYVLYGQTANESPADSTTYYFGSPLRATFTTTATQRKIFIPYAGTITRVDTAVFIATGGTTGTAETSTLSLRLNNTTDTTISSAIVCNQTAGAAATFFNTTGLSVAVVVGDYIELKWATPAWVTNPVSVNIQCQIFVA